jgi:hypothetical protein
MGMTRTEMIAALDDEIERLEKVRTLLQDTKDLAPKYERALARGGVKTAKRPARRMTPEGRRRIIEAQKRRWAKQREAAAK